MTRAACLAVLAMLLGGLPVKAAEPTQPYTPAADPTVATQQHEAYDLVHRYETLLNAGDADAILALFAPDGVAEWNTVPTAATAPGRRAIYEALFRTAKFSTVFGYASVDAYGDTAVVRTFHHEGATVLENGKKVVDLNREVFVLRRIDGRYRIALYIFNTDPVQGEG